MFLMSFDSNDLRRIRIILKTVLTPFLIPLSSSGFLSLLKHEIPSALLHTWQKEQEQSKRLSEKTPQENN